MQFRYALLSFLCAWWLAASSQLRREGVGKGAEMDDVLKVAKHAHQAGDIYLKEKRSLPEGRMGKDVYLVVGWSLCTRRSACAHRLHGRQTR